MRIFRRLALALLVLAARAADAQPDAAEPVVPTLGRGQPTMAEEIAKIRADALRAYGSGAFEMYLRHVQDLTGHLPNHADVAMRLAAAQARLGREQEALATLDAVARMGVYVDFDADARNAEDFKSLVSKPAFQQWRARIKANAEPRIKSTPWHLFADANLLPEDVTVNPKDGAFYVSSVLQHKVIRVDRNGKESTFALEAPEKDWNVLGVAVDPKRSLLWISAQAIRDFPGIAEADAGKARLAGYGLKSGKRLYSHDFPPATLKQAAIGDIAVAANSALFASDSEQGKVYRISADRKVIDVLNRPFFSPQDIAADAAGKAAFVADYVRGIARVDLDSGEQQWLSADRGIALNGIDGLYLHGNGLLAVQNGVHPARIVWLALDKSQTHVERVDVLERGEALGEPTHGVIVGQEFVYLANSGWNHLDDKGAVKAGEKLTPPVLRKLKLP